MAASSTLLLLAGALTACAETPVADAPGAMPSMRVLVKLASPSTDRNAIAAEASRQAGVPVRYAAAVGPQWHALSLRCADSMACEAAFAGLQKADSPYLAVERDDRKSAAKP